MRSRYALLTHLLQLHHPRQRSRTNRNNDVDDVDLIIPKSIEPTNTVEHSCEQEEDSGIMSSNEYEILKERCNGLEDEIRKRDQKMGILVEELKNLKADNARIVTMMEQEEEHITMTLLKKLKELKMDKEKIANHSEAESENLALTLAKQVKQLQQEKGQIAYESEVEEENRTNNLQRKITQLEIERKELLNVLTDSETESSQEILNKIEGKLLACSPAILKEDSEDSLLSPTPGSENELAKKLSDVLMHIIDLRMHIQNEERIMQELVKERKIEREAMMIQQKRRSSSSSASSLSSNQFIMGTSNSSSNTKRKSKRSSLRKLGNDLYVPAKSKVINNKV